MNLRPISDDVLLARLQALVGEERERVADIVEHLAEIDRRDFIIDRGFKSLFHYCVTDLCYSEAAAFLRIRAARASRLSPRVLTDLRRGAVTLDAVMRLYPHLTPENSATLLERVAGASKLKVLSVVAGFETARPERDVIRPLPAPPATSDSRAPHESSSSTLAAATAESDFPTVVPPPSRLRFSFTADDELVVMVDRLRGHLRHRFPEGRLEDLFKAATKECLERIEHEKSKTAQSAAKAPRPRSRRIPKAIKVEVWNRDGGRCAFVAEDGRRCESRDALEYDHIQPWALGGRSDMAENVRLLCRPHNLRLARRRFGPRRRTVV